MIIWSGRGYLPVIVFIGIMIIGVQMLPKSLSDYSFVLAFFSAASFSMYFGLKWNNAEGRIVLDEKTGERFEIKPDHSLFFIPLQYWVVLFGIPGMLILFQNSTILGTIASLIITASVIGYFIKKKEQKPKKVSKPEKADFKKPGARKSHI